MRSRALAEFTLATLASNTFLIGSTRIDAARLQGTDVRKIAYTATWTARTAFEGPLLYGVSVGLTVAELKEWFEADSQSRVDTAAIEESQRHAVILGSMGDSQASSNDEVAIWRKSNWPGWDVIEGEAVNMFVVNADSSAFTTGGLCKLFMQFLGEWRED